MPLLTDEEIDALADDVAFCDGKAEAVTTIREAARLAGERAAAVCEKRGEVLAVDVRGKARAWDCLLCAAAIREASK